MLAMIYAWYREYFRFQRGSHPSCIRMLEELRGGLTGSLYDEALSLAGEL